MKKIISFFAIAIIFCSCGLFEDNKKLMVFESETPCFPALLPDTLLNIFRENYKIDVIYDNNWLLADSADILIVDYLHYLSRFKLISDTIPNKYMKFALNSSGGIIPFAYKEYKIYSNIAGTNEEKPMASKRNSGQNTLTAFGIQAKNRENFLPNFYAVFNYLGGNFNIAGKGGIYNSKNIIALEKYADLAAMGLIETENALTHALKKNQIKNLIRFEDRCLRNISGIEENNFPDNRRFGVFKVILINKKSVNKSEADEFLNFILTDSLSGFFNIGLPDLHYTFPLSQKNDLIADIRNWNKLPGFKDLKHTEDKLFSLIRDVLIGRESASQALKYFEKYVLKNKTTRPDINEIKKEIMKIRKRKIN